VRDGEKSFEWLRRKREVDRKEMFDVDSHLQKRRPLVGGGKLGKNKLERFVPGKVF
jgi:hypothetical protein